MATKLNKNIQTLSDKLGRELEVIHTGVTGGYWPNETYAIATRKERSNCAEAIKKLGEFVDDPLGGFYHIENAFVVTGACYGGSRHHKAKQVYFAIVR